MLFVLLNTDIGFTFYNFAIELYGGEIKVESETNNGSAFIFTILHGLNVAKNLA